jgi:hypothetical protein
MFRQGVFAVSTVFVYIDAVFCIGGALFTIDVIKIPYPVYTRIASVLFAGLKRILGTAKSMHQWRVKAFAD